MIVTCEKCNTSFDLDDSLIRDAGSEVKCSECDNVFTVYKSAPIEEPGPLLEPEEDSADSPRREEPDEEEFDLETLGLEEELEGEGLGEQREEAAEEETLGLQEGAAEEELDIEDFDFEGEPEAEGPAEVEEGAAAEEALEFETEVSSQEIPEVEEDAAEELDLEAISRAVEDAAAEPETAPGEAAPEDEVLDFDLLEPEEGQPGEESIEEIDFEGLSLDDEEEVPPEEEVSPVEGASEEEAPEEATEPMEEEVVIQQVEVEEEPEPVEEELMPSATAREAPPAGRRIGAPIIIVLVLLLAGGAIGAYVFLKGEVPFLKGGIPFLGKQKPAVVDAGNLHITLPAQKISTEFVENSAAGQLFVIRGMVRNDYPEARNFIKVRGVLYAQNGKAVQDKTAFCGNILSESQLKTIDKAAMDMRLQNRFGDGKTNFEVASGAEVPFMVLFSDLPHDFGEYSIQVVSSAKTQ